MSSFSDTFTKNQDGQEELLNYDDAAAMYFCVACLACTVIPWTWSWIRSLVWGDVSSKFPKFDTLTKKRIVYINNTFTEEHRKRMETYEQSKRAKNKKWNVISITTLAILWLALFNCAYALLSTDDSEGGGTIKAFNPFEILGVTSGATDAEIKKAYRKMSLIYHPDKNPDDPLASARFIQVTKAYNSLTDPAAKANYEKYGNPDGPQTTKVGIGLPRFLLEKKIIY